MAKRGEPKKVHLFSINQRCQRTARETSVGRAGQASNAVLELRHMQTFDCPALRHPLRQRIRPLLNERAVLRVRFPLGKLSKPL